MRLEKTASQPAGRSFAVNTDAFQNEDLKKIQGKYSPASVLLITIIGIAVAEIIAMIFVYFQRHLPYPQQVAIDATVMTVIIFPLLYFLSFRPIIRHIKQRYQVELVLKTRLRIVQFANTHTLDEILQFTLDEIETLTGSVAGYFYFIEADQSTVSLQAWSTNGLRVLSRVGSVDNHYSLDQAGTWAECVRQRQVVIHNEEIALLDRKGPSERQVRMFREMAVPIMRDAKTVAVLGMGNKPENYSTADVEIVFTLADFTWDIIKQRQAADAQRESEEKFRTLADWTYDWELWLDCEGNIVYSSPSCARLTGYDSKEFSANPELLLDIVCPEDRDFYIKHHQLIHDALTDVEKVEFRILARGGEERWVEHICRPVFGTDSRYLGRRVSNRDITQRKLAERELVERNRREKMLTETIHTMQLDIARDLHDTIGQNISYLRMKLEYLSGKKTLKKIEMQTELQTMTEAANESYDLIRGTLAVLQSGNSSDLFRIFSRYAEQIEDRSPIQVEFSSGGDLRSLSPKRMRQLFYIFREALTNIEKHAQATQVSIRMDWDETCLSLIVTDDGRGFDPDQIPYGNHYGLKFMKERVALLNGSLNIQSSLGQGTKLAVQVPYE